MPRYKYLIIGGGMTADAAVGGIRQVDADGTIGVIGIDSDPPYSRPPLSKGLWKNQDWKNIWLRNAVNEASLHLGCRAEAIDPQNNTVTDDAGEIYAYERLLLATGGKPRRLPFDAPGVIYFRTAGDYQRLSMLARERQRFAVIGGGFIGSEIAAALAMNNKQAVLIFPGPAIGERMFPPDLSRFLNDFYHDKGVQLRAGEEVVGIQRQKQQYLVQTRAVGGGVQNDITVDAVVAGIGIEPDVELARQIGLEANDGIRVDSALRTTRPNIYAAGDVAQFFNPALGKHLRVEHEDNANTMGEMAGRSMADRQVSYDHLPSFYSDLFELGYEAVGELDRRLEIVADWKEPFRQGVVYYLSDGRVRGVLLWNVWGQVDAARQLIAQPGPFKAVDLAGRIA